MPVTVTEHAFSRKITAGYKNPDAVKLYTARGSIDENEVLDAVLATISETYDVLTLQNVGLEHRGGGFWDVQVKYEIPEGGELESQGDTGSPTEPAPAPDGQDDVGPEFSAETTSGTFRRMLSIDTVASVAAGGGVAPNFKRAIGVTKEKVEGVDVQTGGTEVVTTFKVAAIKWDYVKACNALKYHVNDEDWMVWRYGEVLYKGATFSYRGGDGWSVTHRFSVAENEEEVEVSDDITLTPADRTDGDAEFAKLGWEYLWCDYLDAEDGGQLVQRPRAAYLEQVYPYGDFTKLGFGKVA